MLKTTVLLAILSIISTNFISKAGASDAQDQIFQPAQRAQTVIAFRAPTLNALVDAAVKSWEVGERNVVNLVFNAGTLTGLRVQIAPWRWGRAHVVIEAIGGIGLTPAGLSGEVGAGSRVELVVATDHRFNALYISPGLDFRLLAGNSASEFLHFEPYTNVYFVSATADISWLHEFSPHFGWQVLGAHLGGGVALSGQASDHTNAAGMFIPEIALFTGFRF